MDVAQLNAYAAGFYDGEGWLVISVERGKEGRSDNHHIGVFVTQRVSHREPLDLLQAEFGGTITIRDTKVKGSENWAEQADWHIHTRAQIEKFCRAVQPYCLVKTRQVQIALEFVTGFQVAASMRDNLGRVQGRTLSVEEIQRRERLRLELQVVNVRGSTRTEKIERAPREIQHIDRSKVVLKADPANVSRGEHRYNSVLNDEKVRLIRSEYAAGGVTMDALALRYGVTATGIRQVVRRLTWQHVE